MNKMTRVLAIVTVAGLAASIALAAAPGGGGGRGAGRGRSNTGDTAPSTNPTAKSLSRPTTPTTAPGADGFIRRWLILEPISPSGDATQNAFQATAKKEYFPNQMTVIPKDGDKVTVNGAELAWHSQDTKNFNVNLVHFANDLRISSADSLFWVVTVVNCPEEMKDARLAIGSNDASIWWVNGLEVIGIYGDRQSVVDDGVSRRLTLKKGPNVLRAAIHNARGQTDFCARILDKDLNPVTNITVSLSEDGK